MTEPQTGARPSQVTMAGWVAAVGSALLVLTLFDAMSKVRSIEMRESIDQFLSTPPGDGLGLDAPQVVELLRGLMLFSGAAAAAAMVLAIYVLRRNNAARVGYTVAAVAIMVTAPVSGGFLPVVIAFAAMMLWTKPARDWFSGNDGAPSRHEERGSLLTSESHPPSGENRPPQGADGDPWPRVPDSSAGRPLPPPTHGFGAPQHPSQQGQGPGEEDDRPGGRPGQQGEQPGPEAGRPGGEPGQASYPAGQYPGGPPPSPAGSAYGGQPPGWPPPYGQPPQYGVPGFGRPQDAERRPTTVTVAAWVTWVLTGLTVATFLMVALALVVARDEVVDQLERNPDYQQLDMSAESFIAAMWVATAIVIFWGVAAMVLAWFAYRRSNLGRIGLVVSAGFAAILSLVGLGSLVSLGNLVGAVAVIVLLFTGGANRWYARSGGPPYSGYPPGYGGHPYGQQYGQPGQPPQGQPGQPPYGQPGQPPYGQPGQPPYGQPGQQPGGDRDEPPKNVW